jgi:hypothetical protein
MPILGIMASQISGHLWAPDGAYDALATITPTSSVNSITFTGIPNTYKHLQIRANVRCTGGSGTSLIWWRMNGLASTSNYASHGLGGDGSSAYSYNIIGSYAMGLIGSTAHSGSTANAFSGIIMDVLDYSSSTKNKTVRSLRGEDFNGSGDIRLSSGLFISTDAVSSLTLGFLDNSGSFFNTASQFSLYGVR